MDSWLLLLSEYNRYGELHISPIYVSDNRDTLENALNDIIERAEAVGAECTIHLHGGYVFYRNGDKQYFDIERVQRI